MIRTGIYGGSFNPIHRGHIELGNFICQHHYVDELWFVVSPQNPFKKQADDLLDDRKRLALAQAAVEEYPWLKICDVEFHMPRPSYMYKTLEKLTADYPNRQFVLIIGADNWLAFDRWAEYRTILERYEILIFPRTGSPIDAGTLPKQVTLLPSPIIDISATEIRDIIRRGGDASALLPPAVWKLIRQEKDYKE